MAISSKRPHSDQGTDSGLPLKRRSFIINTPLHGESIETPRGGTLQFIKDPECFSSNSSDDDFDKRNPNYIRFTSLNPKLVEAVSRYSDSDNNMTGSGKDNHYQICEGSIRRKSLSRPGSFSSSSKKCQVTRLDLNARERCFDYIVQSIDEVWARYCDTTSNAEAVVYNNLATKKAQGGVKIPTFSHSHKSLNISENETESDNAAVEEQDDDEEDDESSGYKSEATNPTEYETDYGESRTVSNLPDSVKLQSLKYRLTKAKNDLEQVYDSKEADDSYSFWRRWDMIKYSAVEMMEDDDDDEVIENAIDELEQGRCNTY